MDHGEEDLTQNSTKFTINFVNLWVLFGTCSNFEKNNYSQDFIPLFYFTPCVGHLIKKYKDDTRLQSIVQPSFFLRPRFSRLRFSRYRSPFSPGSVSSPLSLSGPPLYILGPLPDLVCMVRPVARCRQ
ncbi:hypothetical protein TNCV_2969381 [Trichonephila clavipes]|nr:hypothetical protein TNCV_2969381 [Trichonephila clavipes]